MLARIPRRKGHLMATDIAQEYLIGQHDYRSIHRPAKALQFLDGYIS